MKLRGTVLAAGIVLSASLGLAACAAPASPSPSLTGGPAPATVVPTTTKPTPTPTRTGEDTIIGGSPITENEFLTTVRAGWRGGSVPADALLLQYGRAACDQLEAGKPAESVQVLARAEVDQANNELLVKWGARRFCPKYS